MHFTLVTKIQKFHLPLSPFTVFCWKQKTTLLLGRSWLAEADIQPDLLWVSEGHMGFVEQVASVACPQEQKSKRKDYLLFQRLKMPGMHSPASLEFSEPVLWGWNSKGHGLWPVRARHPSWSRHIRRRLRCFPESEVMSELERSCKSNLWPGGWWVWAEPPGQLWWFGTSTCYFPFKPAYSPTVFCLWGRASLVATNAPANAGDTGWIPGPGRSHMKQSMHHDYWPWP